MTWNPIETAPINIPVLIHYTNASGKSRIIKAFKIEKFQEENNQDDYAEWCDYDEETDAYYSPAGWYECIDNWGEFSSIMVNEGEPDYWMNLPPPPNK